MAPRTCVFSGTLSHKEPFHSFMLCLKESVRDVNLDLLEAGWSVSCMDSSHVALFRWTLSRELFSEYVWTRPLTVGLHVDDFVRSLSSFRSSSSGLRFQVMEGVQVSFVVSSLDTTRKLEFFTLDLESLTAELPPEVTTDHFQGQLPLKTLLKEVVSTDKSIGDHITFSLRERSWRCVSGVDGSCTLHLDSPLEDHGAPPPLLLPSDGVRSWASLVSTWSGSYSLAHGSVDVSLMAASASPEGTRVSVWEWEVSWKGDHGVTSCLLPVQTLRASPCVPREGGSVTFTQRLLSSSLNGLRSLDATQCTVFIRPPDHPLVIRLAHPQGLYQLDVCVAARFCD